MALSSMIHQNVYMFHKTIEENIVLGKKFMENAVHTAVQNSGLYRFLDTKGLDYQVGENGSDYREDRSSESPLQGRLYRIARFLC